jgi:hypothetical protein
MTAEIKDWRTAASTVLDQGALWHALHVEMASAGETLFDVPDTLDGLADAIDLDEPNQTYVLCFLAAYDRLIGNLGTTSLYTEAAMRLSLVDLWCSKQADYGHGNITRFGDLGVIVRMSDKVERLKNLDKTGAAANNESVMDSWRDLLGYAVIGMMLEMDLFHLPLVDTLGEWEWSAPWPDTLEELTPSPLVAHRHDPVYACNNTAPTTAGCHIYPESWKP